MGLLAHHRHELLCVSHTHTVTGKMNVPEIFVNDHLIGGQEDLQRLEHKGQLEEMIKECLSSLTLSDFRILTCCSNHFECLCTIYYPKSVRPS